MIKSFRDRLTWVQVLPLLFLRHVTDIAPQPASLLAASMPHFPLVAVNWCLGQSFSSSKCLAIGAHIDIAPNTVTTHKDKSLSLSTGLPG